MATISPAEAAHFRFPNTLQGSGSGSGKSIKILAQRSIKNRGDAHFDFRDECTLPGASLFVAESISTLIFVVPRGHRQGQPVSAG